MIKETSGELVSLLGVRISCKSCPIGNEVNTTEKSDYNEQYTIDDFNHLW